MSWSVSAVGAKEFVAGSLASQFDNAAKQYEGQDAQGHKFNAISATAWGSRSSLSFVMHSAVEPTWIPEAQ